MLLLSFRALQVRFCCVKWFGSSLKTTKIYRFRSVSDVKNRHLLSSVRLCVSACTLPRLEQLGKFCTALNCQCVSGRLQLCRCTDCFPVVSSVSSRTSASATGTNWATEAGPIRPAHYEKIWEVRTEVTNASLKDNV